MPVLGNGAYGSHEVTAKEREFRIVGGTGQQQPQQPPKPLTVAQLGLQVEQMAIAMQAELNAAAEEDYRRGAITREGLIERKAAIQTTEVAQLLDVTEQAVIDRQQAAERRRDAARQALRSEGDAAEEERRSRYTDRVLRQIDNTDTDGGKIAVAQRLLDQAKDKPAELSVLIDELPSMVPGSEAWLPAKVAEVCPEVAAAERELVNATQVVTVHQYAFGKVREGFRTGTPMPKEVLDRLSAAIDRLDPDR